VAGFPRAVAINDVPIDSLMRLAGIRFAGHSPERFRYRALAALSQIEGILQLAGARRAGGLAVRLGGPRGDTVVHVTTEPRREAGPLQPAAEFELAGPIAVLTIRRMTESADSIVRKAVETTPFRASRAVLIDVRGNDGGTRDVLETIVPLFIRTPLVYNVAVVRVDTNGVGDRALVVPEDGSLPEAAKTALRQALAAFSPTWDYRVDDFLPIRFGSVLMPADSSRNITGRPVAVLTDEGCFSSCDIFLGAMRLAPDVTLIGTPSAGGSGRSRDFTLPSSRLTVVLSTMASFQPNGLLYDGIGIRPTIVVERTIADLATGRDTQKEAAVAFLRGRLATRP
jgi:C-terminal processing protease CtpA/Prc